MRPRWQVPLRLLQVGAVVLPALGLLLWGLHSWQDKHRHAIEDAKTRVELVREYALRVIQAQQSLLSEADAILGDIDLTEADLEAVHRRLSGLAGRLDHTLNVGVVTADGRLVATSSRPPEHTDVRDRAYFTALRNGADTLFVDRIVLRPSGREALVLAQRRSGPGFTGILVAAVDIRAFTDFFARLTDDPRAAASLMRGDGLLLVRHYAEAPPVRLPADAPAMRAIAQGDRGLYEAHAISDGVERIYAFSRLGELPIYAHYGVGRRSVFEAWRRDLSLAAAFFGLSGLLGFGATVHARRRLELDQARRQAVFERQAARDKALLLREAHHRIKNNLQMIQSMIGLRRGSAGHAGAVLDELQQRIAAIAQVHELLYDRGEASGTVELGSLLESLCRNAALVPPERRITVSCAAEPVTADPGRAIAIALIVVELLTNALKHAFPNGRSGTVAVSLAARGAEAVLTVRDDGVGLASAADGRSSGLRLVDALTRQIGGRLTATSHGGGAFTVTFPKGDQPPVSDDAPEEPPPSPPQAR